MDWSEVLVAATFSDRGQGKSFNSKETSSPKTLEEKFLGIREKNLQGLKSWAWLPKFCRTFVFFCVRVLQQFDYYANPSAEPSCRTSKVLQNSAELGGAQAHLLRTSFASSQNALFGPTLRTGMHMRPPC